MADVSTIEEFVDDYNNLDVSHDKMHYKELDTFDNGDKVILLADSVLTKYRKDLEEIVTTKTFTGREETKYFCNPQYLSFDLYGSTQYWSLLLELNNMSSAIEFTRNPIKVYDGTLPRLVDSILSLEEESIDLNNDEIEESTSSFEDDTSDNVYEEDE